MMLQSLFKIFIYSSLYQSVYSTYVLQGIYVEECESDAGISRNLIKATLSIFYHT